MMSLCEVCASEPFKYRCPTCGLMSCSLACIRTHKIYCAPQAVEIPDATDAQPQASEANVVNRNISGVDEHPAQNAHHMTAHDLSPQIKDLLERYPPLRDQLREIYQATLEEQWVERPVRKDRGRYHGKGKQQQRTLGSWTREKGFKRGLGKVRKYRGQCEDGLESLTEAYEVLLFHVYSEFTFLIPGLRKNLNKY
ncbi:zinc finger HIT domain-containing protein [Aspergillus undulatus]|uniref:zinc finger HIT domain-containing protein n=1 Tax=Aspergillus undulatus TaxID=1810928 RepID=UPI003CCD79C8